MASYSSPADDLTMRSPTVSPQTTNTLSQVEENQFPKPNIWTQSELDLVKKLYTRQLDEERLDIAKTIPWKNLHVRASSLLASKGYHRSPDVCRRRWNKLQKPQPTTSNQQVVDGVQGHLHRPQAIAKHSADDGDESHVLKDPASDPKVEKVRKFKTWTDEEFETLTTLVHSQQELEKSLPESERLSLQSFWIVIVSQLHSMGSTDLYRH